MEEWLGMAGFGYKGFGAGDHEMATLALAATLAGRARFGIADAVRGLWLRLEREDGRDRQDSLGNLLLAVWGW